MSRLDGIEIEELQDQLGTANGKKPVKRLLTAIAYKQGDSKERLAERHDVSLKTIYNWLDRFENNRSSRRRTTILGLAALRNSPIMRRTNSLLTSMSLLKNLDMTDKCGFHFSFTNICGNSTMPNIHLFTSAG